MSSKFLVGLTGSIACYKTCALISQLVKAGHEVQVVATPAALEFVGRATLEGLSQRPVACEQFVPGQMMDHIALARWADIFVVAPLTANHLAQFANGLTTDLLTTLYLAFERHKPIYLAPAMNTKMYEHPATKENLQKLRTWGAQILEPSSGTLACGEVGPGKMQEPELIFNRVTAHIQSNRTTNTTNGQATTTNVKRQILVTYGGTQELIDGVRSLTNFSSGRTGVELIRELTALNHEITALASTSAQKSDSARKLLRFSDHQDLFNKLKGELTSRRYDAVVHLAAVSDYTVESIEIAGDKKAPSADLKLSSEPEQMTLHLKRTPKIVSSIKTLAANPNCCVIAFKLTKTRSLSERTAAVQKLLHAPGVDYVVHNDLYEILPEQNQHRFTLYKTNAALRDRDQLVSTALNSTFDLAIAIDEILTQEQSNEVTHDLMS